MRRWTHVAMICAMTLTGCDDYLFGELEDGPDDVPAQTGYAGVVEIAQSQCLGCHSAATMQGGLDLETDLHAATVGVTGQYILPIVLEGQPRESMLYMKITDSHPDNTGTDMPPGSGGISDAAADVVFDWILDGAPR
ncbi:MAG: hypothetical protein KTR31_08785 [Myxococcales bacterium]|nr:hypothetical protein [Myxococcales bacterium]